MTNIFTIIRYYTLDSTVNIFDISIFLLLIYGQTFANTLGGVLHSRGYIQTLRDEWMMQQFSKRQKNEYKKCSI